MKSLVAPQSTNNSTLESKESSRHAQMRPRTVNRDACSGSVPSTLTPPSVEFSSGLLVLVVVFSSSRGRPPPGLQKCLLGRCGPFSAFKGGMETVPCHLDFDLVSACSTFIPDALVLGMAVDSLDSHGPSGLVHHNCSNAYFLNHFGVQHLGVRTVHYDIHQCRHVVLLGAWQLHRGSSALAQSKPCRLQLESAWG